MSDEEWQMKLCLLTPRSPPAVWPGLGSPGVGGFHRKFKAQFTGLHPSIWNLISLLMKKEILLKK